MRGHQWSKIIHLLSPEVKQQNSSTIPMTVIWGHQRSKSRISEEFKMIVWGHQRSQSKFSQDFTRSWVTRGRKLNFPRIPKILPGVTRGQKAKFPKNSQDRQGIALSLSVFWLCLSRRLPRHCCRRVRDTYLTIARSIRFQPAEYWRINL